MRAFKSLNTLLHDTRGTSEYVGMLILVVCVALFGLGAYQAFGQAISDRVNEAAEAIPEIQAP